jgi:hypothetical protein
VAKRLGKALKTGPACAPFRQHLTAIRLTSPTPSSWLSVKDDFLTVMESFDDHVTAGEASDGERQNGKGDYFNDLLAVLLEQSSNVTLDKRTGVNGLIFPNHNLDITYPQTANAIAEVLVEAKMMGTPQHPGNATTQTVEGRPGSADLLKRCKEAGFKTIDLKAAYGMLQSAVSAPQQQGMTGDLTSWLRTAKPRSYLALAVRVTSKSDAEAAIAMAQAMTQVVDGCGVFLYRPTRFSSRSLRPASYEEVPVPSAIQLVRVMQRITQDLIAAKARVEAAGPEVPTTRPPSAMVEELVQAAEDATD